RIAAFAHDPGQRTVKVAMEDPGDLRTIALVETMLGLRVEPYLAMPSAMKAVFKEYKKDIYKEFDAIIAESITTALESGELKNTEKMAEFVPIVTITDGITEYAVMSGASDIHIERLPEKVLVRYRVDGILRDIVELPKEIHEAIAARIKILSGLQIDVHFTPQDGRFKFKLEDQSIDVRVSIMPTFYGEKIVMRLLRSSIRPLNLAELGISEHNAATITEAIKRSFGMVLVTGPTGSGKTTTLYAMLHILNTPNVNIATIEDPIEYDVQRLNQTQVNAKAGITFANGLRSLMRQNPDIIMVGEIRDNETVGIALNAAMTGHLVLSTLHTNDAPTAIPRLIDMGGEPFLLASTLNVIIAQRLVRKSCSQCVTSWAPPDTMFESIKKQLAFAAHENAAPELPKQLYKGRGCPACSSSGYSGQIGIFEILHVTPAVKALIKPDVSLGELRAMARGEGMKTMFEDGLAKAQAGLTTIEEIFRVIAE
ncbi:MAG: GspE/PulE family protein, partial [Patescibacteria group bacterium]